MKSNIIPRVQVSIVPKKGCFICMDSNSALALAASLIQQVRHGNPNADRYEGKTYCFVPEHDVPTGSHFTICVIDNLDELYESEKDKSND